MRVIQLSDLHFGADDPRVVEGLRIDLLGQTVDQVLVSGDLTMRARASQFRRARALLDSTGIRWTCVPGNHDLPLDRPARLLGPLRAYRRWISADPEPLVVRDDLLVLGLSTARPYLWKGGRVGSDQLNRIETGASAPAALKILMVHHPVFHSAQRPHERLVRGTDAVIQAASKAGIDVIVCGHDHIAAHALLAPGLLGVMCGTTTSRRLRGGESQSYNVLELAGPRLTVRVRRWSGSGFAAASASSWLRTPSGWQPRGETS